jgi:hypothetical protein
LGNEELSAPWKKKADYGSRACSKRAQGAANRCGLPKEIVVSDGFGIGLEGYPGGLTLSGLSKDFEKGLFSEEVGSVGTAEDHEVWEPEGRVGSQGGIEKGKRCLRKGGGGFGV